MFQDESRQQGNQSPCQQTENNLRKQQPGNRPQPISLHHAERRYGEHIRNGIVAAAFHFQQGVGPAF